MLALSEAFPVVVLNMDHETAPYSVWRNRCARDLTRSGSNFFLPSDFTAPLLHGK